MPETLYILVGEEFKKACGGPEESPCYDVQAEMEHLTEELGLAPRIEEETPEEGQWFDLVDILHALVLRIEALEE